MRSDAEEFTELYRKSYRTLVRYICVRTNDRELAEDLADEVFRLAWEKKGSIKIVTLGWLFTTARNLIGNEYQRRDRERTRVQRAGMAKAASTDGWDVQIEHLGLRLALAKMRPEDSLMLQLIYWHGLSSAEAARFFECTVGTLWVRLSRARSALRILLEDPDTVLTSYAPKRGEARG